MASTHLTPSLRRLAIFLVAIALVAAISPGLALAANGTPKPVDDAITTQVNEPATGNVLTNDINLGEGDLTVTDWVDLNPAFGTLTIDANGDYEFTPAVDWTGSTSTTYTVANSSHEKDGNILITVTPLNVAPVANDDTVTVDEDTPTDVTSGLLANDTDADAGDTLAVTAVSNASNGSAVLDAGSITFTSAADFCGTGSFDYDISDGHGGTASASVTVTVTCTNDAPVAVDDTASGSEDTPLVIDPATLLANDTDADAGDTLAVTAVSNASNGSAVLDAGSITFTSAADFCGTGSFDYDISDGHGGTASASVTVTVTCTNDAPVAVDDTASGSEDTPLVIDPATLLANDTDADAGDTLAVTAVSNASNGSAVLDAGSITFTSAADFCGTGSFDYDISDGHGGTASASVTVTVTCANDAPVAVDDTASGSEDTPLVIDPATLLANDTDADAGDTLAVTAVSNASNGSAVLDAGSITFTSAADFCGTGSLRLRHQRRSRRHRQRQRDGHRHLHQRCTGGRGRHRQCRERFRRDRL